MILSSFFLCVFVIVFMNVHYVIPYAESPSNYEYEIVLQGVGYVPQLDGSYYGVLINIIAEDEILRPMGVDSNKTAGYFAKDVDSIYLLEQYSEQVVYPSGRCYAALFHELKHAEWSERNIDFFDQHEWMKVKYKCH